ncbi:lysophospholipase [Trametes versicolor FP-101664 SS1]|uniref:lysophospholipase n=1 Tax=Trametes versicolor (strain FP-101664) TaxID=717944 RepID=UPI0004621B17|nr:lysophospholipase [Trametes versicolor FP-101664 SS1]EIW56275.1 lysophospholipase [Trametes versicolor FP-101664 SS1]
MKTFGVCFIACACYLSRVSAQALAAQKYAPTLQPCPDGTALVREAGSNAYTQALGDEEARYVSARQSLVLPNAWASYLRNVQQNTPVVLPAYVDTILSGRLGEGAFPNLGIATSGGGLRAALFGAGVLSALDGRNQSSVQAGLGGLLQAAQYLSGLSGGSWLVSSLSQADFPTLPDLIFGTQQADADGFGGWITPENLLEPGANSNETAEFLELFVEEVHGKWAAGFPVSVADVWGRSLARHFVNGTTADDFADATLAHGAGLTLSGIANVSTFRAFAQPFPIVIADSLVDRPNGTVVIVEPDEIVPLVNPIYEFNAYESGSFDPMLGAFTPTKFLGSPNGSVCALGFDQLSFIQGASSNLFNSMNTSVPLASSAIGPIIGLIEETMPQTGLRLDSADIPNPFFGLAQGTFVDTNSTILSLVDGGEDGQTTPLQPLLVRARGLDTIIAIDAVRNSDNFADGSSLIATQTRVQLLNPAYAFPPVPSTQAEYIAQNLTKRPTFFGCNSAPDAGDALVVYIANGGAPLGEPPLTNNPTAKLSYTADEAQAVLNQVFDVATQGIPVFAASGETKDPEWPACLACAVVDRARRRLGLQRDGVCVSCFERYCYS